jgi:hypothetical protein
MMTRNEGGIAGFGFGSALAITISWSQWHSVLWAIIHGVFGWLHVAYYVIRFHWR